jgi:hypothetical protein
VAVEVVAIHLRQLEQWVLKEEEKMVVWLTIVCREEVDIIDSF